MPPPSQDFDTIPAQALWVQLATRITTQSLHYRSGEEETAATSVAGLFGKVRELLEEYPDAAEFRVLSMRLLNDTLRPYTARWHGWMTADEVCRDADGKPVLRFRDEQVRRQFRQELRELQVDLRKVRGKLAELACIDDIGDGDGDQGTGADLGQALPSGVQGQVEIRCPPADTSQAADKDAAGLLTPADINAVEQDTILRRRLCLGTVQAGDSPATLADLDDPQSPPVVVNDAVGLALSGGGIRSATFCLGIVQVLARKGLLPQVDYLSTVSGGGYFGSFLSTALGTRQPGDTSPTTKESAEAKVKDVFHRQEKGARQQGIESGLLRHLRNNSKYILGGGFLGVMRIAGLLVSGLLWNVMIMLPIPLFFALLAYWCRTWLWGSALIPGKPVLPAFTGSPAGLALCGALCLLAVGWLALPGIHSLTHGAPPKSKGAIFRSIWERSTLVIGLIAGIAGLVYLVPALFHGQEWVRVFLRRRAVGPVDLPEDSGLVPAAVTGLVAVLAALVGWLGPRWRRVRASAVKLLILSGPLLLLWVFLLVGNRMGLACAVETWCSPGLVARVVFVLLVWSYLFVNINTLAPHRYYRNRLCECYLARRFRGEQGRARSRVMSLSGEKVQGTREVLQQVKLSSLGEDLTAPYHLINMTLNVPTSDNKNLRGRGSDFFLASRHVYGSPLTGYARTTELEKSDPDFDLGTAMAVSGAAASTSMGWKSLPHLRFLMTLFNVRLGYWLRRPGMPPRRRLLEGAGPMYLFREMGGWMDEHCRHVNLSDGGHIENLAVYELLRRRCKFIVCVDGGHEPGMECVDLNRLQRYAEIDLGIRLQFDTGCLQIGGNGLSRAHAMLVKIDYGPDRTTSDEGGAGSDQLGWMLLLKLAMTGVEPSYVHDYKRESPAFPHETTGDQIYSEAQFEAYRALGECAMDEVFRDEIVGDSSPDSIRDWFQCLANNLLPDNDEVFREPTA